MRVSVLETVFYRTLAAAAKTELQPFTAALYGLRLSADRLLVVTCARLEQLLLVEPALPGGLDLIGTLTLSSPATAGVDEDDECWDVAEEVSSRRQSILPDSWLVELRADSGLLSSNAAENTTLSLARGVQCRVCKYSRRRSDHDWIAVERCDVVGSADLAQLVAVIAAPCSVQPRGRELRREWRNSRTRPAFLWRPGGVLLRTPPESTCDDAGGDGGGCVGVDGLIYDRRCCDTLLDEERLGQTGQQAGSLSVDCCLSVVQHRYESAAPASALTLHVSRQPTAGVSRPPLTITCLAMIARQQPLHCAASALASAADRQLELIESALADARSADASVCHFLPVACGHPIVWVQSAGDWHDLSSEHCRRRLHQALLLPLEWPALRPGNRRAVSSPSAADSRRHSVSRESPMKQVLVNVHVSLSRPDWARVPGDVQVALVHGEYSYYHYGLHGVEDAGWGCAYRSLQTLASWFVLQGFVDEDSLDEAIPTHRAIQQCLVRIGDKPSTFIGSKQWIGSAEVGFCLESLLGVTSRTLHVPCGAEMTSHCLHQLLRHFRTEGTPVMVGGGQLAHTLLGVALEEGSDRPHYLVLDPHYTASSTDLQTVVRKGWCGWKGEQFWNQTAYYNLCMPLRPRGL